MAESLAGHASTFSVKSRVPVHAHAYHENGMAACTPARVRACILLRSLSVEKINYLKY